MKGRFSMDPIVLDMMKYAEIEKKTPKLTRPETSALSGAVSFEELLSSSMKEVNTLQLESDALVTKLATGDVEDISEVVLASSRAEIALKMFLELRNKFVDAYQQLSRISG